MTGEYNLNRLTKTISGTTYTVAYFCPLSEVNPVMKNDLFAADRTGDKQTLAKDKRLYHHEVVVQGEFVHSSQMAADHKAAVQSVFSRATVTPLNQMRRVIDYARSIGGQYNLYLGDDQYTATTAASVNYGPDGCTYPQVVFDEIRPIIDVNSNKVTYTLKFISALPE